MSIRTVVSNLSLQLKSAAYYGWGNLRAGLCGVRLGPGARVSPRAKVSNAYFVGDAVIGRDVVLGRGTYINSGYLMSGVVGEYCSLAYNVVIGPTEHDPDGWTTSPAMALAQGLPAAAVERTAPPPIIEDEVWLGANVVVLRGVRIGKGSVVAAGAVVTKDIPPGEIWGGVPARFIRPRRTAAPPAPLGA